MIRTRLEAGTVLLCMTIIVLTQARAEQTAILVNEPNVVLHGPHPEDWFGAAMAIAGDVNDDGLIDIVIGAPVADPPDRPGSAYVHDATTGNVIWALTGDQVGDKFGAAVAGIGDVNGDGHADLLVGAPSHDAGGADAGRAYVFSGATGQILHTLTGEAAGDWFGYAVAAAGLIDDDNVPDFIVTARAPSNGRPGFAYIYSGATATIIRVLQGEASGHHFGAAVAGGDDVNRDGVPDVLVSAIFHPAPGFFGGRAYVFSGLDGSVLHTFTGEGQSNFFGDSVAIPGDVNGDGAADLLIGADGNSAGGTSAGRAYVYSGADGALLYTITGSEAQGRLGRSVSAAGDVNGDGYADLLIGQPAPTVVNGSGNGQAFIHDGFTGRRLVTFQTEKADFFGFTCVGGADLTGDGKLDAAIGTFTSSVAGFQAGRVEIFHSPYGPAVIGDINGDGLVNVNDLLLVITAWGPCPGVGPCDADVNGNGVVGVDDLLIVVNHWS